ncbi:MAG: NUDIX domain-containing protein [Candidatus Moraniibacteriota bacterium]|nr:MAG: NUDIX domain-containing protein [Candidatus Moranbacteria bacterium]
MAFYNKIGLLVLNKERTKFLVCEKDKNNVTNDYIMPGGQFFEDSIEECLKNEIKEELDCEINFNTLQFIGEYIDIAAGVPTKEVSIQLYQGDLIGDPTPSSEIKFVHWVGKNDASNTRLSPIVKNKIIPDLLKRSILKPE